MSESSELTHLNKAGEVHMVDVGDKEVTRREATAEALVSMSAEMVDRFVGGGLGKGDAAATARIAGIQAAKRTWELVPLAHPIELDSVAVDLESTGHGIRVRATVSTHGRTGVEMEAITAVSISAITVYDMVKSVEREVTIEKIRLLRKSGGRSGAWERE